MLTKQQIVEIANKKTRKDFRLMRAKFIMILRIKSGEKL